MDQKRLDALLDTVTPMVELKPYARALIYGDYGTGKTIMGCDYGEEVIMVDSANGWVSLQNHPSVYKKVKQRFQYKGLSQLDALSDAILEGKIETETLVLDELSSMAVLDLDVVLRARSAKDSTKDPDVATQPDYGANTERVRRTAARLLTLPCNVVLLAHVREDKDERTGRIYTRPAFTPKMRGTIIKDCHIVGYLTANEIGSDGSTPQYLRRLQVHPTASITAKTRIGDLPTVIDNPDLNTIFANWQNRIVEQSETVVPETDGPVSESSEPTDELSLGSE